LHDLYKIFRICGQFKFGGIAQGVPDYDGLTSGFAFSPKFSVLLAAKLYVRCKNIVDVQEWCMQEWHGPPLSLYQVWVVGLGFHTPPGKGAKISTFFVFCPPHFLIIEVSDCEIVIKVFEYGNDFDTIG